MVRSLPGGRLKRIVPEAEYEALHFLIFVNVRHSLCGIAMRVGKQLDEHHGWLEAGGSQCVVL